MSTIGPNWPTLNVYTFREKGLSHLNEKEKEKVFAVRFLCIWFSFFLVSLWFHRLGDIEAEGHLMFPLTFQSVCGSSHGMTFSFWAETYFAVLPEAYLIFFKHNSLLDIRNDMSSFWRKMRAVKSNHRDPVLLNCSLKHAFVHRRWTSRMDKTFFFLNKSTLDESNSWMTHPQWVKEHITNVQQGMQWIW